MLLGLLTLTLTLVSSDQEESLPSFSGQCQALRQRSSALGSAGSAAAFQGWVPCPSILRTLPRCSATPGQQDTASCLSERLKESTAWKKTTFRRAEGSFHHMDPGFEPPWVPVLLPQVLSNTLTSHQFPDWSRRGPLSPC